MKLLDLQLFAETEPTSTSEPDVQEPSTNTSGNKGTKDDSEKSGAKYTDEDVNRILNAKFAKWQKDQEKKASEEKKLAAMNAQERVEAERDKYQSELEELKSKVVISENVSEARRMCQDKGVNVSDDILSMLVTSDAEHTKATMDSFISMYQKDLSNAVKEALKGNSPTKGKGGNASVTKADIDKITNPFERQKMIRENLDLYFKK